MSDLTKTIRDTEQNRVSTGKVTGRTGKRYLVNIDGRQMQIKSAVRDDITPGSTVVMNRADNGQMIVGVSETLQKQTARVVVIHV